MMPFYPSILWPSFAFNTSPKLWHGQCFSCAYLCQWWLSHSLIVVGWWGVILTQLLVVGWLVILTQLLVVGWLVILTQSCLAVGWLVIHRCSTIYMGWSMTLKTLLLSQDSLRLLRLICLFLFALLFPTFWWATQGAVLVKHHWILRHSQLRLLFGTQGCGKGQIQSNKVKQT